ncbi:MAG: hypothetical protein BWY66_01081 [bacterium ADurb.Bin374]|nr:MAG: hypothetical protein BWY66_01081 [bacterium ADurb.Bin374]
MVFQVFLHLADQALVVGAIFVEPEQRRGVGDAGAGHGELDPVADRQVFCLAHAPDIALLDRVLDQHLAGRVDHAHDAVALDLEGLVVRAIFLGFLRHQADVRDAAHRAGIERAVFLAEVDRRLVDARVGAVGNDRLHVAQLTVAAVHLAAGADRRGHRGVYDDVAGHVQVGDALVGVDHRELGPIDVDLLDVLFDLFLLVGGKGRDLLVELAEAVVGADAERAERFGVLFIDVLEEDADDVAEHDRVGYLHHGGFQMHREQHALRLRVGDLFGEEGAQGVAAHRGGVDDLFRLELELFLENRFLARLVDVYDLHGAGLLDDDRLLAAEEVLVGHVGHVALRVFRPGAHRVRVLAGILFHRIGDAAVGIALAQHGIHGAAEDLRVTRLDLFLLVGFRLGRILGNLVAVRLELLDGRLELRDRGADVRQFDDVGLGLVGHVAEKREVVAVPLFGGQVLGKRGQDTAGERDVAQLDRDAGRGRERLDDGQERGGREGRGFVGLGVIDLHGGGCHFRHSFLFFEAFSHFLVCSIYVRRFQWKSGIANSTRIPMTFFKARSRTPISHSAPCVIQKRRKPSEVGRIRERLYMI